MVELNLVFNLNSCKIHLEQVVTGSTHFRKALQLVQHNTITNNVYCRGRDTVHDKDAPTR